MGRIHEKWQRCVTVSEAPPIQTVIGLVNTSYKKKTLALLFQRNDVLRRYPTIIRSVSISIRLHFTTERGGGERWPRIFRKHPNIFDC